MPCRSYEDDWSSSSSYEIGLLQDKVDRLARFACYAMTALEKVAPTDETFQNKELVTWWEAHKIADAKAMAKEQARLVAIKEKRELAKKKRELIKTMSPEDRKILGL
jgi:hypothetical protein